MRLIDADKLIEDLTKEIDGMIKGMLDEEYLDNEYLKGNVNFSILAREIVKNQPTTFDVDKVVKQLEELKEWEDVDGKAYYTMSEKQVINKAIKIVKRGGIDE